jgi:hypothetical protein
MRSDLQDMILIAFRTAVCAAILSEKLEKHVGIYLSDDHYLRIMVPNEGW